MTTNKEIAIKKQILEELELNAFNDGYKKGFQIGRTEQLAKDFIVDKHETNEKDCCVICGKKPDIIIHADCAFEKGVISKRMGEKNDEIARLRKALQRISRCPGNCSACYKIADKALASAGEKEGVK